MDPYQNISDPEHWNVVAGTLRYFFNLVQYTVLFKAIRIKKEKIMMEIGYTNSEATITG
jgi:hypothetical protein